MKVIQECATNTGWQTLEVPSQSDTSIYYLVTIPPWDRHDPDSVSCECPSYEFRGYCRHQIEALNRICKWNELDGKKQDRSGECPECGAKTRAVILKDNG